MTIISNFDRRICTRKNNRTIVVADDDSDNLALIAFVLDKLKLEYYLASNGKAALDLVYEKKPHLALLDVGMPHLNGIEVNILIKNDLFTNHISTIAITKLTELEHIKAIDNAGFDDYAIEPFIVEDLENKIKRYTRDSRATFSTIKESYFSEK